MVELHHKIKNYQQEVQSVDHILIVNDIAAMDTYIDASNIFDVVLVGTGLFFNGNDAIEIVFDGNVIETFGIVGDNPDTNGVGCSTPECWTMKILGLIKKMVYGPMAM